MPRLKDIELFKDSLRNLGKESEVLVRWGESWEELPPPAVDASSAEPEAVKEGIPDDLAALLGGGDSDADASLDAAEPGETDFSSFLNEMAMGELPEQTDDAGLPAAPAEADGFELPSGFSPEPADLGAADLGADIPDLGAAMPDFDSAISDLGAVDLGADLASLSAMEPEPEPEQATEALPADETPPDDDFSVPDSLLAGLGDDMAEAADAEPLEAESLEPAPDAAMEAAPDLAAMDDGFSMPSFDEPPADSAESNSLESGATEDFSFPDDGEAFAADGASMAMPADAEPAAAVPDLGSADMGDSFTMPSFDEEATGEPAGGPSGGLEDFSIPTDLAEPEAGGAPAAEEAFDLGSESVDSDSFEQFDMGGEQADLGGEGASIPDLGADDFAKSIATDDIDGQLAALEGEAPGTDTFSLESSWGGDFSIPGFDMGGEDKAGKAAKAAKPAPSYAPRAEAGEGARDRPQARPIDLTEDQVDALQETLLSYPLNLRLAIEDIIANNRGADALQSSLIWLLVEGAAPKEAAKVAGRALKRFIPVPESFAKRTGAAFEDEKGSLGYIFTHSIWPVLQVLVLVAAAAGICFFLGYNFVYRPLKAQSLYTQGYRQIGLEKFGESMEFFEKADKTWTMKGWHYRYARAYAGKGQYARAEAIYDRLLYRWPKETKAALEYASMETSTLNYEKAESVLKAYVLERDYFNRDALLLMADNYLAWADFESQRYEGVDERRVAELYESARLYLATVMERHGRTDAFLERMLIYFIRTERSGGADKLKEVLPLVAYFVGNDKSGFSAATLAELGDYLVDREQLDNVNEVLLRAVDRDGSLPEAHVAMAKWNRRAGFPDEERKALEFAARFFAEAEAGPAPLSTKRVKSHVLSLIRLGELLMDAGRSLDAEDALNKAIDRYERAVADRRFKKDARYGIAYSRLADIYYRDRMDFKGALALYQSAEDNGYTSPETDYRRGFIYYNDASSDGQEALRRFYLAGLDSEPSPYLLWATGNALYARGDYFAAQGYYAMLADRLQFELDTIAIPTPQARGSHAEIVELLMLARNNLGAALYRVGERMGDVRSRSDAVVQFTESARLFDSLSRDQTTMVRSDSRNLGFLNLDFMLHPRRGIDLAIYSIIPTEMDYPKRAAVFK